MGIRYYAYPLQPSDIESARASPRAFMADDPLADAWGSLELRPRMLYLDKCWAELQDLFGSRPASLLVQGSVTHTSYGWIPHLDVLDPETVGAVAEDLARVTEADVVASGVRSYRGRGTPAEDADEYVMHFLAEARTFTKSLTTDGLGLIYMIG